MADDVEIWRPKAPVVIPANVEGAALAEYARQLSPRDQQQIRVAFESESYEMGTLFLWSKTMSGLRRQLAGLGMMFIGEMLDRGDITADSSIENVVTDYEAVNLAEELGMFDSTQALRLRQAMELVGHFADRRDDMTEDEVMTRIDAGQVLLACVKGVLGHERLDGAVEFAEFRNDLVRRPFKADDPEIVQLLACPYFFRRTTLRVLLSLVKNGQGASLEHALANANTIIPVFWPDLLEPDKWLVGRAFAEVNSAGKTTAATGLRAALTKVRGFDFVPEDLRSRTFISASQGVLDAHFAFNNFHNEPKPMRALAHLGTVIPKPAFAKCATATLCVRLGNHWGTSRAAQPHANELLASFSEARWFYYLQNCLPGDDTILAKLTDARIVARWLEVVSTYRLAELEIEGPTASLLDASGMGRTIKVVEEAKRLYRTLHA